MVGFGGMVGSGVMAGLVAVIVTVAIEKLGGLAGGIIATLPTTIVPASIGLYYQLSEPSDLASAMYSVPVAMLVDIFFLLCWRFLLPRVPQDWALSKQVAFVVATTLAVWLLLAGVVALMLTHIFTSTSQLALAGSFALVGSVVTGLLACVTPPEAPTGQNKVPPKILVARGVCAGTAISIAIALSGLSGVVGGIFSVFPAIFYTTMIGLWLSQGDGVPLGAIGPMVLGSTSVSLYALLFGALSPSTGPWGGAVLCWGIAALAASLPAFFYVRWRSRVAAYWRKEAMPDLDDFDLVLQDFDSDNDAPQPPTIGIESPARASRK